MGLTLKSVRSRELVPLPDAARGCRPRGRMRAWFRGEGLGWRVKGLGFGVEGLGFMVQG